MMTGTDEPGEPFTYSSSTFTAPTQATPVTPAAEQAPQAQSFFTLESTTSSEASDLAALSRRSFISCTKTWWKTSPVFALLEGLASEVGSKITVGPVVVRRLSVPSFAGEHVVAYEATGEFDAFNVNESFVGEAVIIGAGRVETALNLSGTPAHPFPRSLGTALIEHQEHLVAQVAAS
jgi:hypothetical protein